MRERHEIGAQSSRFARPPMILASRKAGALHSYTGESFVVVFEEPGLGLSFESIESFFGASTFPGGTNVAQVFPDSGVYCAVLPGTGGTRIR